MDHVRPLAASSDDDLLHRLVDLLRQSRRAESDLVAHIAEVELRQLYARAACPSMYVYCTQVLRLSEAEAYARIAVARASLQHPTILEMLADGRVHLTGIARLVPHLTLENRTALLERATHKSRREIEALIAEIAPRPDVISLMRRLPSRKDPSPASPNRPERTVSVQAQLCPDRVELGTLTLGAGGDQGPEPSKLERPGTIHGLPGATVQSAPHAPQGQPIPPRTQTARPAVIEPLGNARYKVQFTASAELHHKLERLRALMRSQVPDGDLAAIVEQAVSEKLECLESRRFAKTSRPRKGLRECDASPMSRHIPAPVRRAVYERDGGRCRYVDEAGRRCPERDRLEFHHRYPFGMGGGHSLSNIGLMCRAHNAYLADHDYGREAAAGWRQRPAAAFAAPAARSSAPADASP